MPALHVILTIMLADRIDHARSTFMVHLADFEPLSGDYFCES
jgi:hypothetical protein